MNLLILLLIIIPNYLIVKKGINKWNELRIKLNSDYQNIKYISDYQNSLSPDKIIEISNHSDTDFDKNIEEYDMFYLRPGIVDHFKELEPYQKLVNNYRKLFFSQCILIIGFFILIWISYQLTISLLSSSFQLF